MNHFKTVSVAIKNLNEIKPKIKETKLQNVITTETMILELEL